MGISFVLIENALNITIFYFTSYGERKDDEMELKETLKGLLLLK